MSDVSDEENDFTEEQTEYTEGGEENDETKKMRKSVGEENEDEEESESEEENAGEENEDEDGSEGGEENEENDSTNEGAEDGEAAVSSGDIDVEIDGNTKEVVKKLSMKEKFNDMERKKILIISLIFSLIVSLPSGLGIGLGTAPVTEPAPIPDYCSYPKFKPCRENGKCVMVSGIAECECNTGWKGELCNMPNCDNDAACVAENSVRAKCTFQLDRGVICHCKEGFTGHKCETDLCGKGEYNSCNDHGTCVIVNGLPTCQCNTGWEGELCNMPNCDNDAACVAENSVPTKCSFQQDRGVICHCKEGFTGHKCEDETDLCQKSEYNSCHNHGTCSMIDGMPTCTCEAGWTGITCAGRSCTTESGSDYCTDENTSFCDESDGYAVCNCNTGYYGVTCEYNSVGNGFGRK